MSWITDALSKRVAELEAKLAPAPAADVKALEERIAALEAKAAAIPPELTGEEGEIGALDKRLTAVEIIVGSMTADQIAAAAGATGAAKPKGK